MARVQLQEAVQVEECVLMLSSRRDEEERCLKELATVCSTLQSEYDCLSAAAQKQHQVPVQAARERLEATAREILSVTEEIRRLEEGSSKGEKEELVLQSHYSVKLSRLEARQLDLEASVTDLTLERERIGRALIRMKELCEDTTTLPELDAKIAVLQEELLALRSVHIPAVEAERLEIEESLVNLDQELQQSSAAALQMEVKREEGEGECARLWKILVETALKLEDQGCESCWLEGDWKSGLLQLRDSFGTSVPAHASSRGRVSKKGGGSNKSHKTASRGGGQSNGSVVEHVLEMTAKDQDALSMETVFESRESISTALCNRGKWFGVRAEEGKQRLRADADTFLVTLSSGGGSTKTDGIKEMLQRVVSQGDAHDVGEMLIAVEDSLVSEKALSAVLLDKRVDLEAALFLSDSSGTPSSKNPRGSSGRGVKRLERNDGEGERKEEESRWTQIETKIKEFHLARERKRVMLHSLTEKCEQVRRVGLRECK